MENQEQAVVLEQEGAFITSLKRNNTKIRQDRGEAISEDTEMTYSRTIQDLLMDIKKLNRTRENMLDLSPTNSMSLMVADDFQSSVFVKKDLEIGVQLREKEILLEIAQTRYAKLFGKEFKG